AGAAAGGVVRINADVAGLARTQIEARNVAAVFAGVDDVWVGRVGGGETGLAAADGVPVARTDAGGAQAVARPSCGADVLHRATDMMRHARIDVDVVELVDGKQR